MEILYEDNHIIAVVKPAGVLAQPAHKATAWQGKDDIVILDLIKHYLKEKYKKPGNVFLGLVHRLDRPVSGIMIFAKTSKGASRLSQQFRDHQVQKTYQAIVVGRPTQPKGVLTNHLIKDEKLHKAREKEGGQEARLFYEVLKSNGSHSLLKITIEGGKFHQIRSQLSLAGMPIVGDVKYGAKSPLPDESVALCATEISFKKATEDEMVHLKIEPPKEWENYLSTEGLDLLGQEKR